MDQDLCEAVCHQSTWLAELLVLLLVVLRAAWLTRTKATLVQERDSLQEKVRELSLRPPAQPSVTLQLAPHPGLASLYPIGMSTAPAEPQNTAKSAGSAWDSSSQFHEPDEVDPDKDGP
jgi:hypothetical protein